ncbi:MAG: tryptophan synthase alpha chain [Myxococcales bacterium]
MSRVPQTFARLTRPALIPYLTAGDPDPGATAHLLEALAEAGADLIELGVPFSDPMADGPVIQRAAERALRHGISLDDILDLVATFRLRHDTPVILFGYYNPFHHYGDQLARRCAEAGVDGLLVVDLPPEEAGPLRASLAAQGLDLISLLTPTSGDDRVDAVQRVAGGFVYYVSLTGVTGAALGDTTDLGARVTALRARLGLPVAVGFGIATPEQAAAVGAHADGVVVGSALVRLIETHGGDPEGMIREVRRFLTGLRRALDGARAAGDA